MGNRQKRKVRLGGVMLVLGSATLLISTFLSEGVLRWVCRFVAGAFMILAIVSVVGANRERD